MTRLVAGHALAHVTALSAAPDATAGQEIGLEQDLFWFGENVPCRRACPADTDIPGYLEAVHRGDFAQAYRINLEDNVFPGVLGRVCSRPCESACRHGEAGNGEPVAICFAKRAGADHGCSDTVVLPPLYPKSGRKVAVVGAGVAGLACARELARLGHAVTVFEKHHAPGGMLNQGIPEFRLPRAVIAREIAQVTALGVEIRCGVSVGGTGAMSVAPDELCSAHDALVLAAGTLKAQWPAPWSAQWSAQWSEMAAGRNLIAGAEHGLNFLLTVNEFGRRDVGRRVLVIGGGYTALDCARTALRLGAQVTIAYRRERAAMVVLPGEIEEFLAEGGVLQTRLAPLRVVANGGRVSAMRFVRTRDSSRRGDALETVAGSECEYAAEQVIFATGQNPDFGWLTGSLGSLCGEGDRLASGAANATSHPKIFAAGDFALGATTLISAIGHARQCARAVDRFLTGEERMRRKLRVSAAAVSKSAGGTARDAASAARPSLTGRDAALNLIPLTPMPVLAPAQRGHALEVETGYDADASRVEASRCYLCNYKFEIVDSRCVLCDECLRVKPVPDCIVEISALEQDDAGRITGYRPIERDRTDSLYYNRLWIDQSRCIRCGACETVCPVNAITVQKVSCESSRR